MDDFWWLVIVNVLVAAWVVTTSLLVGRAWSRAIELVQLRRECRELARDLDEAKHRWRMYRGKFRRVRAVLHEIENETPASGQVRETWEQTGRQIAASAVRAALCEPR